MSFKRRESHKISQKLFYIGHWLTVIATFCRQWTHSHSLIYSETDDKNVRFTSNTVNGKECYSSCDNFRHESPSKWHFQSEIKTSAASVFIPSLQ